MAQSIDTAIGGSNAEFPPTSWHLVRRAHDGGDREDAIRRLCERYWKPTYVFLRKIRPLEPEDAKDLTQDFFLHLIEGRFLERFEPERGSLRKYLKGALRLFALQKHESESRQKRGGGEPRFSLGPENAEVLPDPKAESPEEAFDRQWARSVLDQALGRLREDLLRSGQERRLQVFEAYARGPQRRTQAEVAAEFGLQDWEVKEILSVCYQEIRENVLDAVRDYVGGEREATAELAWLLLGTPGTA